MRSYQQVTGLPCTEEFIGTGDTAIYNTVSKMKKIISESSKNPYIREWAQEIVGMVDVNDKKNEVVAVHNFVRDNVRYTKDPFGYEYIQTPPVLLESIRERRKNWGIERPIGDCVSGDTEIILRDKQTQKYVLKNIEDLEHDYDRYEALSYDFGKEEWKFNNIVAWQYRGIKESHKIKFYNGTSHICTLGHKMFNARVTGGKLREINIKRIDEIDFVNENNHYQTAYGRVFCAKKIPSLDISVNKSDSELWVDGMYVSEGYRDIDGRVNIAQDKTDVTEKLVECVAGIGGTLCSGNKHQYVRFNQEESVRFYGMGNISEEKQFLEEHLSMPEKQIKSLLYGYFDGDGSVNREQVEFYTTISKKLSRQLSFVHLVLGEPLYMCDYGRLVSKYGKHSIIRLYRFLSEIGYIKEILNGVSLIGIKSAKFVGNKKVFDITVEHTHNFVSSTGTIFHNCDDMTVLSLSLLKSIGFPVAIKVVSFRDNGQFSHVYGLVKVHGVWTPIDTVRPDKYFGWEASNVTRAMESVV